MALDRNEIVWLLEKLSSIDFLSLNSEEELARLIVSVRKLETSDGELLIRQGQRGEAMYFIYEGAVSVVARLPEGEKRLARLEAGDHFGETAVLTGETCNASVYSSGKAVLFALPPSAVAELVDGNPALAEKMAAAVSSRKGIRAYGLEPSFAVPARLADRIKLFLGLAS